MRCRGRRRPGRARGSDRRGGRGAAARSAASRSASSWTSRGCRRPFRKPGAEPVVQPGCARAGVVRRAVQRLHAVDDHARAVHPVALQLPREEDRLLERGTLGRGHDQEHGPLIGQQPRDLCGARTQGVEKPASSRKNVVRSSSSPTPVMRRTAASTIPAARTHLSRRRQEDASKRPSRNPVRRSGACKKSIALRDGGVSSTITS